jgi:hypothetical protein
VTADRFAPLTQFDLTALSRRGGSLIGAFRSARATGIVVLAISSILGLITIATLAGSIVQLVTGVDRTDFAGPTAARLTAIPGAVFSLVLLGVAVFFVVRFFNAGFRRQRMAEFARTNGLEFVGYRSGAQLRGVGFQAPGDARWHEHVVRGILPGARFEVGNFEVTEQSKSRSGKSRTTTVVRFAYLAVRLPVKLPHTFFDATQNGKWRVFGTDLVRWDLEGDFPSQFRTFTERGRERDMLESITPDVMQIFSDHGLDHDIELTGDLLILMRPGANVADPATIGELLGVGSTVASKLDERLRSWQRPGQERNHP